ILTLSAVGLLLAGAWQSRSLGVSAEAAPAAIPPPAVAAAAPLPGLIKDEHLRPVPTATNFQASHVLAAPMNKQHSEVAATPGRTPTGALEAAQAATSTNEFLTRPYLTWHNITSVFDHCNP